MLLNTSSPSNPALSLPTLLFTPPTPPPLTHSPSFASPITTARPVRRLPRIPPPPLSPTLLCLAAGREAPFPSPSSSIEEAKAEGGTGIAQILDLYLRMNDDVKSPTKGTLSSSAASTASSAVVFRQIHHVELPFMALVPLPCSPVEVDTKPASRWHSESEKGEKQEALRPAWDARKKREKEKAMRETDERIGEAMEGWGF